jgi:hypothetical protein
MAWRWRFRYSRPLFGGGPKPNLYRHGAPVTFGGHGPVHYTTGS